MNHFDITWIPSEIWYHIFHFINDERTLSRIELVCKQWKAICEERTFTAWGNPYQLIWHEPLPLLGPQGHFLTAKQAFQHRFCYTLLHKLNKTFKPIPSIAETILQIRQQATKTQLITPLECHNSTLFWQQQFILAHRSEDKLGKIYAAREILLLLKAKGREAELEDLQNTCLEQIIESDDDKEMYYDFLQHLLVDPQQFRNCILQWSDPYILIFNSVRYGWVSIVDIYLEANEDKIAQRAPFFLAEAAETQQFSVIKRLLAHQPPLSCVDAHGEEETALHNLCSLLEEEVTEDDYLEWQNLIQQLVTRGCNPMQRDPMGLTSFHRAVKKYNSKFLDYLLQTFGPLPPVCMLELKEYLLELADEEGKIEEVMHDKYHEDEIDILNVLLKHAPFLSNEFQLQDDLCWYPWILQSLLNQIDEETEQQQLGHLFEALLHTPYVFISDLLQNYTEFPSLEFLQAEIHHFMKIFDRQIHRLIQAGLNLNYTNRDLHSPLHLLILSLRSIENRIFLKLGTEEFLAKNLFSQCYSVYCRLIQAMITSQNYHIKNHLQQKPVDLAILFRYQDLQAVFLLLHLSAQDDETKPPPSKRPRKQR